MSEEQYECMRSSMSEELATVRLVCEQYENE